MEKILFYPVLPEPALSYIYNSTCRKDKKNVMENVFLPIDDLVFAPVNAIKEADIQLSNGILKQIATFSEREDKAEEIPVMKLKNIKFLYDRAKSDEEGEKIETMGLTVPTASIVPLSALQIYHSAVKFHIELKTSGGEDGSFSLLGKPAAEKRRKTDFLPKMSFHIKTECAPLPEGVARLIDVLDINQIPSVEEKTYVDTEGIPQKNQELYTARSKAASAVRRLEAMIEKLNQNLEAKNQEFQSSLSEEFRDKLSLRIAELSERRERYSALKEEWKEALLHAEIKILEEYVQDEP